MGISRHLGISSSKPTSRTKQMTCQLLCKEDEVLFGTLASCSLQLISSNWTIGDIDHPLGLEIPVLWAFKWSTVVQSLVGSSPQKNSVWPHSKPTICWSDFSYLDVAHGFQRVSCTFFKQNSKRIARWFVGVVSLDESDHWIMWFWWKPFLTFGE